MMKPIQFTHLRSAMTRWGFFLLLPVGMIAVSAQCRKKSDEVSPPPAERSSARQRNVPPGDLPAISSDRPKRLGKTADLSVDDLVAIYERNGAAAALDAAKALTGSQRDSQVLFILSYLARIDPEFVANELPNAKTSAQAWFDSLPESAAKTEAMASIGQTKASTQRSTIVCGPATAPDESWKTKQVSEMKVEDLRNWAYQDKAGARRFLEQSPDNPALSEMVITVAACMASDESPQAVFDWALKLSPLLQADALRLAVSAWSGKDPAAAAEKIRSIPADRRGPLALAIADNWARQDPAASAAWVADCNEPNQPALVVKVIEQWAGMEPEKAYGWLGTLPAGAARDEGISLMMRREARHDPASLLPWVDQISQAEMKRDMSAFLQSWLEHPNG